MSDSHENFQNSNPASSENSAEKNTPQSPYSYPYTTYHYAGSGPSQQGGTYPGAQQNPSYTGQQGSAAYPGNTAPAPGAAPAYTWNGYGQARYNPYVQPAKPAKKKKGVPFVVKLLAVVLVCALTSAATLAVFVGLVQNGTVRIESASNGAAAFTIAKVVNSEPQETGTVSALSEQDIAEKLIPSVVCIQNFQISQRYGFLNPSMAGDSISPAGEGSGIIFREDGYIATNAHVVADATELKVILSDGTTYEADLVASDELTDLAVVKIDATGLPAAEFGSSSDLRVADRVMAIGNPGGHTLSSTVTFGYVSALNRPVEIESGYTMEYIQTDAAINPGNSGGALVNEYGQVIGINSAKISDVDYEGLGFAIPTDFAQGILSDLMEYGYVKDRAMLGIRGQFIDRMTGMFYGLPQGEYVGEVTTKKAESSGLQVGDVITAIDGTDLTTEGALRSLLNTKKPGDTSELTVYRPQTDETLTLKLTYSEYEGE